MVSGVLSIPLSGRGIDSRESGPDGLRLPLRRFVAGEENQLAAVAIANLLDDAHGDDASSSKAPHCTGPLVFHGPTGTGKSHLAIGLGIEAARRRHHVVFSRAADLVRNLLEARDDRLLGGPLCRLAIRILLGLVWRLAVFFSCLVLVRVDGPE